MFRWFLLVALYILPPTYCIWENRVISVERLYMPTFLACDLTSDQPLDPMNNCNIPEELQMH